MTNSAFLACVLFVQLVWGAKPISAGAAQGEKIMTNEASDILANSPSPQELLSTALTLAGSAEQADHLELTKWLTREEFLMRLDSVQDYRMLPEKLRLWRILETLKNSFAASARAVAVALIKSGDFTKEIARQELLVRACATVRPAPPEVIGFWDAQCQPEGRYKHLTIRAVVDNGSPPALALFEKKMKDPAFDEDDKKEWMYVSVLTHRNDLHLLQRCDRLLRDGLAERLRPVLVEALFDYRVDEWFSEATAVTPPPLSEASVETLLELRKIGQFALPTIQLTEPQKVAVRKRLEEIDEILKRSGG